MRYLKVVLNEFQNVSPAKREIAIAQELGFEVLVLATTKNTSNFQEHCDGYDIIRISTRRFGNSKWRYWLNRCVAFLNFIEQIRSTDVAIISGYDLSALLAAYIGIFFKRNTVKLIYDSREFELYRNASRNVLQNKIVKLIEGFLVRRANLSLMVGDKIADGVQEVYKLKKRPTVVRNIPAYWHLDMKKSAEVREKFMDMLGLKADGWILMTHGAIMPGRGIECAIRALSFLPEDVVLVVLGFDNGTGTIEKLKSLAEDEGCSHRVLFHPAVPMEELKGYVCAADLELVLIEGGQCLSYAYSLPNKFFESIQACVPMVCCDLPEMGKLVRQYDIGLLVNENDAENVAEAVIKLRNNKQLYTRLKRNMEKAKEELCWEKESLKLKVAIKGLMGERRCEI